MKRHFVALVLLGISLVGCASVLCAEGLIEKAGVYKYQSPQGWTVQKSATGSEIVVEKKGDAIAGMIDVEVDHTSGDLRQWAEASMARNKKLFAPYKPEFTELSDYQTEAGVKGFKFGVILHANGNDLHNVMYVFAGSNDAKIVATCMCQSAEVAHYEPIFEAAMKTFIPE